MFNPQPLCVQNPVNQSTFFLIQLACQIVLQECGLIALESAVLVKFHQHYLK